MFENADAELLARFQFAFTVAFHIIFPSFSIGLASFLAVLEGLWLITKRDVYMRLFKYWIRIFAVAFGMGVVSGVVMAYQFGTNWAVFSDRAGPIIGPLMGYEVLSAFFLEAGFLGIMLFGLNRVGKKLHFFATLMVAGGTLFSAFWILAVNSWMQTPAGHALNDVNQFVAVDWLQVIFTASFPYRLVHMVLAAYLTTALVIGAVGAWHLLRGNREEPIRIMFSMAMWMLTIVVPMQLFAGDAQGRNTLAHQPAKLAAIEGHYESYPEGHAPLILLGWPSNEAGEVLYPIQVPLLGSLILTHNLTSPLQGLDAFPREDWPPTPIVFFSFRAMVGLGVLMLGLGLFSLYKRWRRQMYDSLWLHRYAVVMGPAGFLAVLCGWVTTEVGRQPWTIYNIMRTSDSVSPLDAAAVGTSLIAFIVVYFFVFGAGTIYLLRLMRGTPASMESEPVSEGPIRTAGTTPIQSVKTDDPPEAGK